VRTFGPVRGILGTMESRNTAVEPGEAGLIERARGGDRAAFDLLVESHLTRVWNVVWRILRHREDTEDVVQEVFWRRTALCPVSGVRRSSRPGCSGSP